jgi:hypothetical protein
MQLGVLIRKHLRRSFNNKKLIKMNKKGFMWDFLIGIVIALIIFIPTCMKASELLESTYQAKENFVDFAEELQTFAANANVNDPQRSLLIMDVETIVAYFPPQKDEAKMEILIQDPPFFPNPVPLYELHVVKPVTNTCNDEGGCICLIRSPYAEREATGGLVKVTIVSRGEIICSPVDFNLEATSCAFGSPQGDVHSYNCKSGIIIERDFLSEFSLIESYYNTPRRITPLLLKTKSGVEIS